MVLVGLINSDAGRGRDHGGGGSHERALVRNNDKLFQLDFY